MSWKEPPEDGEEGDSSLKPRARTTGTTSNVAPSSTSTSSFQKRRSTRIANQQKQHTAFAGFVAKVIMSELENKDDDDKMALAVSLMDHNNLELGLP